MNKAGLINVIAQKADLAQAEATKAVNAFIDAITDTLAYGDNVQLTGFGSFEARKTAARTVKNPQTGEAMNLPESIRPAFKAGKALKEAVAKGKNSE